MLGAGPCRGWILWPVLAMVSGQAGLEEPPWGGQMGKAPSAQPSAPASLEMSLARTKFCFSPPGKRFYRSSENAKPQASPFLMGSGCHG